MVMVEIRNQPNQAYNLMTAVNRTNAHAAETANRRIVCILLVFCSFFTLSKISLRFW